MVNKSAVRSPDLLQLHAQMVADLLVPDEHLVGAPVLPDQNTPGQHASYVAARTSTWKSARDAGRAPAG